MSDRLVKPVEASILLLPPMRMLSSRPKDSPETSDSDGFRRWVQAHDCPPGRPRLAKNTEIYLSTLVAYIDKGVPVIAWGTPLVGMFVGYEERGKVLLYITGNKDQPERVFLDKNIRGEVKNPIRYHSIFGGWVFASEERRRARLRHLPRSDSGDCAASQDQNGVPSILICIGWEFRIANTPNHDFLGQKMHGHAILSMLQYM